MTGKRGIKSKIYDKYIGINRKLIGGDHVFLDTKTVNNEARYSFTEKKNTIPLRAPRIAVYAGSGASHSWLWFVDILEDMGFSNIIFLSEDDIAPGLEDSDALLVSGGETFALAHGLGEEGRGSIVRLLKRGGLYFGTCAGACMMMKSTSEPLGLFDLVNIKIANIVDELPDQVKPSNKFSTPYGCAYVFHPVREEVILKSEGIPPLYSTSDFIAPLYGGPPMEDSNDAITLARYAGFTSKTEFLASREKADEILTGKTAVCLKEYDKGRIILSGPHLEHPSFHESNAMIADSIYLSLAEKNNFTGNREYPYRIDKKILTDLKREMSNLRIIALGLEHSAISWLVGRKYYEPEKIRTYAESIWKRITALEKTGSSSFFSAEKKLLDESVYLSARALDITRVLKNMVDCNEQSDSAAAELFLQLRILSKTFFTYYFGRKPADME
ncbi:MAG: Type 1 glutamine amidotransferase-like domain-containing protein [Spirochaetes bacterium]|nr:Type 1 glutamine amidotransferase-like domain-containing protein [Spirochaetota bacterium]